MAYDDVMPPMEQLGYEKRYDFTQFSHDSNINVIPEESFKRLVEETFKTIALVLENTYGPYGSTVMISELGDTITTKDGYNVFSSLKFSHTYKHMVYLAIKKIIDRVNDRVGDGTTSCILLADKLFRALTESIKDVNDKRVLLSVLSKFEENLQSSAALQIDGNAPIKKLTKEALHGMLQMAGNYDDRLADILEQAMEPVVDENGIVTSVRNVVTEGKVDVVSEAGAMYDIEFLPGDYRINCRFMNEEFALLFMNKSDVKIALYDIPFGSSQWNFLKTNYDNVSRILIIARSFRSDFLDNEYKRYLVNKMNTKQSPELILCEIQGGLSVREDIRDLAAILHTEPIGMNTLAVDLDSLPVVPMRVHNGICMCFYTSEVPTERIHQIEYEMRADQTKSMTKTHDFKTRIRSLSLNAHDTLVTVHASSSLELKMLSDKIDDCTSIVQSAIDYGITPNMFVYGYWRLMQYEAGLGEDDDVERHVSETIRKSLVGLFNDIWKSRYLDKCDQKRDAIAEELYDSPVCGYDIINATYVDIEKLPTSAQYDLEVIAASISIVKYLLTSRAFIFDASVLKPVDDTGRYTPLGG